jgi:hypothetical protein
MGHDVVARLFAKGDASVRMTRVYHSDGAMMVIVHGPASTHAVYQCEGEQPCLEKEQEIMRSLLQAGFRELRAAERRKTADRRRAWRGDRRRLLAVPAGPPPRPKSQHGP